MLTGSTVHANASGRHAASERWSGWFGRARVGLRLLTLGLFVLSAGVSVGPVRAAEAAAWTTATLAEGRVGPAVAQVGTQVVLAGGCKSACEHPRAWGPSAAVDVYDFGTGTWAAGQLSQARKSLVAASVANLAIFAGGAPGYGRVSDAVDLYDAASGRWSAARLSQPRSLVGAATVGTQAVFVGGYTYATGAGPEQQTPTATVDIFDAATGQWRAAHLSQTVVEPQVATLGRQVLVLPSSQSTVRAVDVYDADTGRWSAAPLSRARSGAVLAVVGSRALIIGGDLDPATGRRDRSSATVDIYDASTGRWTTATLSAARTGMRVATLTNTVVVAGGEDGLQDADAVDIYDAGTSGWSTASLAEARHGMAVATVGTRALFAGGRSGGQPSASVDIYDASTGEWTVASLSEARDGAVAVTVGDQALLAGGYHSGVGASASVDLYDAPSGTWTTAALSEPRQGITAVASGSRALFAGGTDGASAEAHVSVSALVDVYDAVAPAREPLEQDPPQQEG